MRGIRVAPSVIAFGLLVCGWAFGQDSHPKSAPIVVAVTSPVEAIATVNAATMSVSGTASGGAGITKVKWQTSNGAAGVATGAETWVATGIPMPVGSTTLIVRAYDATGASSWVALVGVRQQ